MINSNLKVGYYQPSGEVPVVMAALQYAAEKISEYVHGKKAGKSKPIDANRDNGRVIAFPLQNRNISEKVDKAA